MGRLSAEEEAKVQNALADIRAGYYGSFKAARIYGVSRSTLEARLKGRSSAIKALGRGRGLIGFPMGYGAIPRDIQIQMDKALSTSDELEIVRHINQCTHNSSTPIHSKVVHRMAETLLQERVSEGTQNRKDDPSVQLDRNWVRRFIKRHRQIMKKVSIEPLEALPFSNTVKEQFYRWVYNFSQYFSLGLPIGNCFFVDETEFTTNKTKRGPFVISDTENVDASGNKIQSPCPSSSAGSSGENRVLESTSPLTSVNTNQIPLSQPTTKQHESPSYCLSTDDCLSVIESVSVDGPVNPPLIVFKGDKIDESWIPQNIDPNFTFTSSTSGKPNREVGIAWLNFFNQHTYTRAARGRRLIVLAADSRLISGQFLDMCSYSKIDVVLHPIVLRWAFDASGITLYPYLQDKLREMLSENIAPFSVQTVISKQQFLNYFQLARIEGLKKVRSWQSAHLFPFVPTDVLVTIEGFSHCVVEDEDEELSTDINTDELKINGFGNILRAVALAPEPIRSDAQQELRLLQQIIAERNGGGSPANSSMSLGDNNHDRSQSSMSSVNLSSMPSISSIPPISKAISSNSGSISRLSNPLSSIPLSASSSLNQNPLTLSSTPTLSNKPSNSSMESATTARSSLSRLPALTSLDISNQQGQHSPSQLGGSSIIQQNNQMSFPTVASQQVTKSQMLQPSYPQFTSNSSHNANSGQGQFGDNNIDIYNSNPAPYGYQQSFQPQQSQPQYQYNSALGNSSSEHLGVYNSSLAYPGVYGGGTNLSQSMMGNQPGNQPGPSMNSLSNINPQLQSNQSQIHPPIQGQTQPQQQSNVSGYLSSQRLPPPTQTQNQNQNQSGTSGARYMYNTSKMDYLD